MKGKTDGNAGMGCLVVLFLIAAVILGPYWWRTTIGPIFGIYPETPAAERPLSAAVHFNGAQFTVQNLGDERWTEVRLAVNSGLTDGGYRIELGNISSRGMATVGALQLANGNGERLNPLQIKPQTVTVIATVDGNTRAWSGALSAR